jgi:hypothetical protein
MHSPFQAAVAPELLRLLGSEDWQGAPAATRGGLGGVIGLLAAPPTALGESSSAPSTLAAASMDASLASLAGGGGQQRRSRRSSGRRSDGSLPDISLRSEDSIRSVGELDQMAEVIAGSAHCAVRTSFDAMHPPRARRSSACSPETRRRARRLRQR